MDPVSSVFSSSFAVSPLKVPGVQEQEQPPTRVKFRWVLLLLSFWQDVKKELLSAWLCHFLSISL